MDQTRKKEDVEDKGNDTGREDDLFSADENSSRVVRDSIGKDQQHPEDTQYDHHDNELTSEGIWETVAFDNG